MITIFYDGKCGLCLREINHYKKISPPSVFTWCDVTTDESLLKRHNLSLVDTLKYLHALDSDGELHVGINAFLIIWRNLPRWRVLAKIVGLPFVRTFVSFVYIVFAKVRFSRLSHCQVAAKDEQNK